MSCQSCHACGTPVRIVLDGEEWCTTCQTYQRPVEHGWGRLPDQTPLERLPCARAKDQHLQHQLAKLTDTASNTRFDLYLCEPSDLNENNDGVYTLRHHALDAAALLPVLCVALHRGAACEIVTTPHSGEPGYSPPMARSSTPDLLGLDRIELEALDQLFETGLADQTHPLLRDWTDILVPLRRKISALTDLCGTARTPHP